MCLLTIRQLLYVFMLAGITACGSSNSDDSEQSTRNSVVVNYQYQVPEALNDDWQTSSADTVGLNIDSLTTMTNKVLQGNYPVVDGIVVIKDHQLVYEHYFNGFNNRNTHELQSAVKSIDSAIVGLAYDQGYITDVDQTIYPLLPNFHDIDWSGEKDKITIKNLLNMRSGFPCQDGKTGHCNSFKLNQARSWTRYTLSQQVENPPGSEFSYFTGLNIISHTVIEYLTGMSIADFSQQYLFNPLGITTFKWSHSPTGEALSGYMLPRDMAKFGQLYLNNGDWRGQQVISKAWVQATLDERVVVSEQDKIGYGYWWWQTLDNNGDVRYYSAQGAKDQYIFIVPNFKLVAVFTGNDDTGDARYLFEKYIFDSL